ncbi:MAG: MBOAT family protein [Clostridium sp.]|nr:MBOAT family protein [Clostridium sp.]
MTFTSFSFLLFFTILLCLYYLTPARLRTAALAAASLLFCCFAGGKRMLFSLLVSTVSTWYAAVRMEDSGTKRGRKLWFYGTLMLNLGILTMYKYLNFFVYTGRIAGKLFHQELSLREFSLAAPLGLSFYTLQVLGYLIDVLRGTCRAERKLLRYTAFSCFFPQLVTGPVNRYGDMEKTLYGERRFDYEQVTFGLQRMAWGFFKKLVISERMAVLVNTVYGDYQTYSGLYIGFATVCFAFQLYTDFSGAMDIALGVSQALGIRMAENFDTPFFASSVSEYWRRWHITLGTWMKDYVFYPLLKSEWWIRIGERARKRFGKKRGKKIPTYLGMMVLWFTVGLWHGGAWKYIIGSGLLHCFYIIAGQMLEPVFKKTARMMRVNTQSWSWRLFQNLRTFFLVCIGFVFFRASSAGDAVRILKATLSFNPWIFTDGSLLRLGLDGPDFTVGLLSLGVLLIISLLHSRFKTQGKTVRGVLAEQNLVFRWMVYYMLVFSVLLFGFYGPGYDAGEFIYQNF